MNITLSKIFKDDENISKIKSGKLKHIELALLKNSSDKIKFSISPVLISNSEKGYFLIGNFIKNNKAWNQNLFNILKDTYNEVGEDFFKSITKSLAEILGMKYAFIGEISNFDSKISQVNTITFWNNKEFKPNFSYELVGTPCENVIDRKQLIVPNNAANLYPNDADLKTLKVKSYIGTPLFYKNGTPMGIVVVMDTKPLQFTNENIEKLHLFANRIGIEMEYVKNDNQLKAQEIKQRTILKSLPNPVYVQSNKGIYEACNDAFLNFFNLKEKEIVNQPLNNLPKIIQENKILSSSFVQKKSEGISRIESTIKTGVKQEKNAIVIKSSIKDVYNKSIGAVGVIQDISEMKEAEKLLKLREEKYRMLFTKANDAFLLMNNDTFIDCNPKALKMFGCSKDVLIGSSPQIFSPSIQPDKKRSVKKVQEKIEEALSGKNITFYWKHKKYNGELFDAEVSLNAFYLKDELLVQAIVRDVTNNVNATKDIEKQTLRMKKMYELTSDSDTPFKEKVSNILEMATESLGMQIGGLSHIDSENYIFLNTYSNLPNFTTDDVHYLSQTYCSITIEENRLVAIPNFRKSKYAATEIYKLLQLESYIGVPYWVRGKLRGTLLFSSFYSVNEFKLHDADFVQIIAQWIGSSIESEEYQENLIKNQALLDTLIREMPIDFSVRDSNLNMLWQSNKSKEIWGDNVGKLIDYEDTDKETSDKWKEYFQRVLGGETIKIEEELKINGKPFHFYSIASPVVVNNMVEQAMVININISQIKNAEKKLKVQNNKLKKLNSELDRFVYSASHDLRAPLTSLLGLIDLSQREDLNPSLVQYLELMNTSIVKLDSFISDITDYSRNLRLKRITEKINFISLINDIYNGLAFMSAEKINFSLKVVGKQNFYSDSDRLKLIISNLLSNSIRYRSLNNKLVIKVDVNKTEDSVEIIVKDNGLGIQKEYQSKVFNMFYRANDQNTGSGLGLFIVKETMDKLKGKIKLESTVNKGTTFTLKIPNSDN